VLDHLVQLAYARNIPLRVAGARVFEARARLGIAIGEQYPQVQQTLAQLRSTEAVVPQFDASLRQAKNSLCILLGMLPGNLDHLLGGRSAIPQVLLEVAVGIPADLLRRRPDIRSAELQAAAQSAQIGVAKADLYPAFALNGTFGFLASERKGMRGE
jgi:outer membrane protein TolC